VARGSDDAGSDAPRRVSDDGLYTPEIKRHSLEKIRLHNRYARIFGSAMRNSWPQLAYVGLYAGAGRARITGTNEIVETSALAVLHQPDLFTDYVYVDRNPDCVEALASRIQSIGAPARFTIIPSDVNESVAAVRQALPRYTGSRGLLSFCFIDPFDLQLKFDTIRGLSHLKMDFLVLLMLGVDARRNFNLYLTDESSTRIADLIDCPDWRAEYRTGANVIHFLLRKFDEAMQRLGYLSAGDDAHVVRVAGMGVLQYVLAFYSKNELGRRFWRESRAGLSPQLGFQL
jgi:three-Cys-motif partner protein